MADNISVYGYDQAMLSSLTLFANPQAPLPTEQSPNPTSSGSIPAITTSPSATAGCPLLTLPFELRTLILSYVLPSTFIHPERGIVWQRGHVNILCTSHRLYDEGVDVMYGSSTALIEIAYKSCNFLHQWSISKQEEGQAGLWAAQFKDHVAHSYVPFRREGWAKRLGRCRRWILVIKCVDDYMGMIKYGISRPEPLALGFRDGVHEFVALLNRCIEGRGTDEKSLPMIEVQFKGMNEEQEREGWRDTIVEPLRRAEERRLLLLKGNEHTI